MKNLWIAIKATVIIVLGLCIYAIMAVAYLLYGLWEGVKKLRVTKA